MMGLGSAKRNLKNRKSTSHLTHFVIKYKVLMATISSSLGIDSSGGTDSECMKIHLEKERGHMQQMKSLFQLLKLRFHRQQATLFHGQFILGSYLIPVRFLAPMATSKIGPQCLKGGDVWLCWRAYILQNFCYLYLTRFRTYKIA